MEESSRSGAIRVERAHLLVPFVLVAAVVVACSGGGARDPVVLRVTPSSGPPGAVLSIEGLTLPMSDEVEVWVGGELAPARSGEGGALVAAVPLFLGAGGWPTPPAEPQLVEVRRGTEVLGRSLEGVTVTALPPAPGAAREAQGALERIVDAYARVFSLIPVGDEGETAVRDGVVAMLSGLVGEGETSLGGLLAVTADADLALVDALLASSGALAFLRESASALAGAAEGSRLALGALCDGDGADVELACLMQVHVLLGDFTEVFVGPTARTYANTVGLAAGLVAIYATGGLAVPAAAIVGAILSVADFVMSKVVPGLLPSKLTQFELRIDRHVIAVGEWTDSRILVTAVNRPPSITYLEVVEQVYALMGLNKVTKESQWVESFGKVLQDTAKFMLEQYVKVLQATEAKSPGTYPWLTGGDIRVPAMTWGPVTVRSDRLVELSSFDPAVVEALAEGLEWLGVQHGEASVSVRSRAAGETSKLLRDHALCLGCVYSGGAFGLESASDQALVIVGELFLHATPDRGAAPSSTTFTWTGLDAADETLACTLDPGDGTAPYAIADCASTTSQAHSYQSASALRSESGSYQAELRIVGTEKVARTDVVVEWWLAATPSQGASPRDVTFEWGGFGPEDGAFACRLEPGDGSPVKVIDDCSSAAGAVHHYANPGSFTATLVVVGTLRQDSKSVQVTLAREPVGLTGTLSVTVQYGSYPDAWGIHHRTTIRYTARLEFAPKVNLPGFVAYDLEHVTIDYEHSGYTDAGDLHCTFESGPVRFTEETLRLYDGTLEITTEDDATAYWWWLRMQGVVEVEKRCTGRGTETELVGVSIDPFAGATPWEVPYPLDRGETTISDSYFRRDEHGDGSTFTSVESEWSFGETRPDSP